MQLKFTKMEGAGNDFVVIDGREGVPELSATDIRVIAHRRTGIGFDQLLRIDPPESADNLIAYRIFNADGSEVQQCGNGARALAAYAAADIPSEQVVGMESPAGLVRAIVHSDGLVSVDMGVPDFEPSSLPFLSPARATEYVLDVEGRAIEFGAVSMGNPHAVIPVNDIGRAEVQIIGESLQNHPSFPESVNVGFMQILDDSSMKLRVYERGAGETSACGTGACAAVAIAKSLGLVGEKVKIQTKGGELLVSWPGDGQNTWLTGACKRVFEGLVTI